MLVRSLKQKMAIALSMMKTVCQEKMLCGFSDASHEARS